MSAEIKPTIFEHEHPAPTAPGGAFLIFLVLAGLTMMALMLGFMDFPFKILASLAISCVQTIVLTLFFMDLRNADKLTWMVAFSALFWTFLLFLFTITDYLTRHLVAH